jgi:V8-like Glu-specific endopeptidase
MTVEGGEIGAQSESLVYGTDDRLEYLDIVGSELQRWADSTSALVRTSRVSCTGDTCNLTNSSWQRGIVNDSTLESQPLCTDVRFRLQDSAASCTGFLVGPDLIATAGHCVDQATDCASYNVVFGYNNDELDQAPDQVPASDVYSCAEIVEWHDNADEGDWALMRLDRSVRDRVPFNVFGRLPRESDNLAILGHPDGLTLKVAPEGEVVTVSDAPKLRHNVDSFAGNSGSPVVNMADGSISAIHTNRPASHFVARTLPGGGTCAEIRVCDEEDGCGGSFSSATRIAMLSHLIPLTPALSSASRTGLL